MSGNSAGIPSVLPDMNARNGLDPAEHVRLLDGVREIPEVDHAPTREEFDAVGIRIIDDIE